MTFPNVNLSGNILISLISIKLNVKPRTFAEQNMLYAQLDNQTQCSFNIFYSNIDMYYLGHLRACGKNIFLAATTKFPLNRPQVGAIKHVLFDPFPYKMCHSKG